MKRLLASLALVGVLVGQAEAAPPKGHGPRLSPPSGVTVIFGDCPDIPNAVGCSYPWDNLIYVRRPGDRMTLWHEYGHIWQYRHPELWWKIRRPVDTQKYKDIDMESYDDPYEDFAELFAECAIHPRWAPRKPCQRIRDER